MNFEDYKTNAKYAKQNNAGYSARLGYAIRFHSDEYLQSPEGKAFQHGWDMADRHESENGQKSV